MQKGKKIIEIDLELAQSILKKSGFEIVKIGKNGRGPLNSVSRRIFSRIQATLCAMLGR